MKIYIGLVIAALIAGCGGVGLKSEGVTSTPKQLNINFYQHWIHSYEEQNGKRTPNIFRPISSREFTESRFRMQFAFDQSGRCNYMFLSPSDVNELRECVYTKVDNTVYLYDKAGNSLNHLAFTIQSVNRDEMRIAYGVAPTNKKP